MRQPIGTWHRVYSDDGVVHALYLRYITSEATLMRMIKDNNYVVARCLAIMRPARAVWLGTDPLTCLMCLAEERP